MSYNSSGNAVVLNLIKQQQQTNSFLHEVIINIYLPHLLTFANVSSV